MTAGASDTAPVGGLTDTMVLDTHAVMALLQDETGAGRVQDHLDRALNGECRAVLLSVSLGEVASAVERRSGLEGAKLALAVVDQFPVEVLPTDRQVALTAGHLKATRGLHYMDALVAALAQLEEGTVVTGDRDFGAVESVVSIEWLPN